MPSKATSSVGEEKNVWMNIQKALEYLESSQPEVVAAARNEGPAAAVYLRRGGDEYQLLTL